MMDAGDGAVEPGLPGLDDQQVVLALRLSMEA
jgi:hypothetical protein